MRIARSIITCMNTLVTILFSSSLCSFFHLFFHFFFFFLFFFLLFYFLTFFLFFFLFLFTTFRDENVELSQYAKKKVSKVTKHHELFDIVGGGYYQVLPVQSILTPGELSRPFVASSLLFSLLLYFIFIIC